MNDLSRRIKMFRMKNRLSQKDFAKACGVHFNTIVRIESGAPMRSVTEMLIIDYLEANNG